MGKFRKGHIPPNKRFDNVFCENSTYARHLLKKRILDEKLIPYVCGICGIGPVWNHQPMPLILDHVNGVNNDDRLENLRFVCSNCDSQLDTYKSRNKGRLGERFNPDALKASDPATGP